jgi:ubiquinone/menaquinone biosynthesis C-methylase UbiE
VFATSIVSMKQWRLAMIPVEEANVLEKNRNAAAMWSSGGAGYEEISRGISAALEHTVTRLAPRLGDRLLDIATGTGWTARLAARLGATVTGVDIARGLLEVARQKSAEEGLSIDWRLGDAERLPFDDAAFDSAVSTFGIMFATDQEAALTELRRVVRPEGRVAVAAWTPDSNAVALRKVVAPFMAPPPAGVTPPASPFNWGDPEWLRESLRDRFDLVFEQSELTQRLPDSESAWNIYRFGFGPVRAVANALDADRLEEMRAAFIDWVDGFRTDLGVAIPLRYCVSVGRAI